MAGTQYYWVDEKSTFGGGENPISYGDLMPKKFSEDERFESFKSEGLISTEKVATKRQLSELEKLKEEVKELKGSKSEDSKLAIDKALATSVQTDLDKIKELEESSGGGDQAAVQTALETSVQTDLDKIKELEGEVISSESKSVQADLDKIEEIEGLLKSANSQSLQSDLDRITELEGSEAQGTLDLIKESLAKIQQGDSKAEIWDAVKSVKDLIEG